MSINTTETMLSEQIKRFLLPHTFNAAVRAGAAVMRIYEHRDDYDLSKYDGNFRSITAADRAAHEAIKRTLGQTRIPILSEDGREMHYEERCNWELFWLVDPLDGTREFIAGNNEFTINIAPDGEQRQCGGRDLRPLSAQDLLRRPGLRLLCARRESNPAPTPPTPSTKSNREPAGCRSSPNGTRTPLIAISRSHNTPRNLRPRRGAPASLSRRPSDRAGQFLQILPASRRGGSTTTSARPTPTSGIRPPAN